MEFAIVLMIHLVEYVFQTKHISCKYKCKFDGIKCNSNQNWNDNKCRYERKNSRKDHVFEKD